MKKWLPVIILGFASFVMVLDSTVMNVSISNVVSDLNTTVTGMQTAITFYTLTMASLMLIGGKLGDIWGRKKTLLIGSVIYAIGSLVTALSQNFAAIFLGWSIIEGLGAVLVIPAIAALVASNYSGKDRVQAYAMIGGVSGAAAAAGPLIGGYMTTYLSWRYVFIAEVVIMAGVILFSKHITDSKQSKKGGRIDVISALMSSAGLVLMVYGMLQSKVWGWVEPRAFPVINNNEIAPFGISIVAYLILVGVIILYFFYSRQKQLETAGRNPLLKVSLFSLSTLRSGLGVLMAQYLVIGAVFFLLPVYLQMTLGFDALKTGIRIMPLSIALIIASLLGARLVDKWSPKRIIRTGQLSLTLGIGFLLSSIDINLSRPAFSFGMFMIGIGTGLIASQISNVNMSSVKESDSSEVGGLQGVFQNLGSSLGTALIGSVLVTALTTSFIGNVQASSLPNEVKAYVQSNSRTGISIVPVSAVSSYAKTVGLTPDEAENAASLYAESQIRALRTSLFALLALSILTIVFSRNIPNKILKN